MPSPAVPPPPRHAGAWAGLTYALATLTLAWPALIGRFLVNPASDQYIGGFPVREFAAAMLKATGDYPLWNPYLFGGMPFVASMNGDMFYPTVLLRVLLPIDVGMSWSFVLHLFLAGFITYHFLRALGFSFAGALVGGLAYLMSGQIASLASAGHDGKLFIAALFPLMMLCLIWGVRDGRKWAWGVLALVSGLGVLTPHPQLYQYMLLGCGAFGLFLAFDSQTGIDKRTAFTRLALALGAVLLGWLIGAVQFAPVLEYVGWSPRAEGKVGWEHAISFSMPPEELINTYLPQFSGILDSYWGRNFIHFHSEYIGASVLALAFAGFGWGRRKENWFWLGMLVVSLLWALGGYTPFYRLVYAIVPGTTYFRAPSTIFFITVFATAVFAARGTERLLAAQFTRRYLFGWLGAAALITLLAVTGALREAFLGVAHPGLLDRFHDPAVQGAIVTGSFRSLLFLLAALGVAWSVQRKLLAAHPALVAVAILVTADLWTVERQYWRFSAPANEIYASDAIIEHIKAQPEPGRAFATLVNPAPAGRDAFLGGDAFMIHRIRLVTGYHGNEIGRYDELIGPRLENLGNPVFWQLANVHWFIYNDSQPLAPSMKRVMGPVTNAAGTPTWLFRVDGENPAAWLVPAKMVQPDEVTLSALQDPRYPVRGIVLFPPESGVQGQELAAVPPPIEIKARTPVYEPGHIQVELEAPAPEGATLVVSENYYPGWRVTIDGNEGAVHRANYSLMGIPLPASARSIDLRFESARFVAGLWITIIATLAALLWTAGGLYLGRRTDG